MITFKEFLKEINIPKMSRDVDYLEKVYKFGKQQHSGQERFSTGDPYFNHPIRVAILLRNFDDEVVAGGLLHDVLEDCDATFDEIEKLAGRRVARLVEGVTKDAVIKDIFGPLNDVAKEDKYTIHIKLADRLDNISDDFLNMKRKTQKHYFTETPKILEFAQQYHISFLHQEINKKLDEIKNQLKND